MSDQPEWEPVTEAEQQRAEEATRLLREAVARAQAEGSKPVTSPGKFTEPLGLDENGDRQPPLTREEAEHNEDVRRRGRDE